MKYILSALNKYVSVYIRWYTRPESLMCIIGSTHGTERVKKEFNKRIFYN